MNKTMKGGGVIGSGSYGCVFKPPLKCKTTLKNKRGENNKKTKKNIISKLLIDNEGIEEFNIDKLVINRIKQLDNYKGISKYFLVADSLCVPEKLKKKDKRELISVCDNMVSKEYLENKLNNLLILNMKYGGKTIDKHIILNAYSKEICIAQFINNLINLLIDLIEKGISNMHKVNLYHTDIKSLNLLLAKNKNYISIIDWGLSVSELPKCGDSVYSGIHFNRPYESLLFNIANNKIIINRELEIYEIINNYLDKINKTTIINDITLIFGDNENNISVLKNYLLSMLDKVMVVNKFNREKFIKEFYVKQDYWGLMTVLMDLYKYFNLRNSTYENNFREIFKYMTGNLRINKSMLISLLKKLKRE